jgi:hypothetical protein
LDEPPRILPGDLKALALALGLAGVLLALWAFLEIASHLKGRHMNSAALSKINWTNGIAFVVSACAVFGIAIPEHLQAQVLEVTALATPLITMVWRTWFTKPAQ